MPAGCNCGPNSPLVRAPGCHCLHRGTAVSCHFRGCKVPLFRIVSSAIYQVSYLYLYLYLAYFSGVHSRSLQVWLDWVLPPPKKKSLPSPLRIAGARYASNRSLRLACGHPTKKFTRNHIINYTLLCDSVVGA